MQHRGYRVSLATPATLAALLFVTPAFAAPLKVACTGTSALMGVGSSAGHHVPDELGKVLGAGFDVGNFGAQGTTAIASIPSSYAATSQMKAALADSPDVVLFWFGGNDSMEGTWEAHKAEFKADYTNLVHQFQALPTHPKTFLVRLWVFVDTPVRRTVLDKEILPLIDQIATDTGSVLIDYRKAFENHAEYFPDGMHPNDTGTTQIGKLFADSVTSALAAAGGSGGAGSGGAASSGGAGGAGAGGAAEATGGVGGSSGGAGAGGLGGIAGMPVAGSGGTSAASAGANNAASGASPLPGAGAQSLTPAAAPASDGGGCRMNGAQRTNAPAAPWLLLAALGLARFRRQNGRAALGGSAAPRRSAFVPPR